MRRPMETTFGRLSVAVAMLDAVNGRCVIDWQRSTFAITRYGEPRTGPFRDGNDVADAIMDFRDNAVGIGDTQHRRQ